MSRPHFLMCPPDYFDVVYEINPWMSTERKVNQKLAQKQWTALYDLLTGKIKLKIELLKPVKGLPDLVFTANGGLVKKRVFVRSNFRHKQRQREEDVFIKWFRSHDYIVRQIERPFCFEGEGDAVFMGKELYTGYFFRSDIEAHDRLAGHMRASYFALELCDKRFYHLDTCFAVLNERSALMYLKAFEPYAQMSLLETIEDPVQVSENEALRFACNTIIVGSDAIIPQGCPKTTKELEKRGFRVHSLDFSEFIKAGGAAKCLVLKL